MKNFKFLFALLFVFLLSCKNGAIDLNALPDPWKSIVDIIINIFLALWAIYIVIELFFPSKPSEHDNMMHGINMSNREKIDKNESHRKYGS